VIAVAADVPRPADASSRVAWLDLNAPEAVLGWLNDWLRK
jgi:molybdopterin-guanine dinucleotide biosynthesis protein B